MIWAQLLMIYLDLCFILNTGDIKITFVFIALHVHMYQICLINVVQ